MKKIIFVLILMIINSLFMYSVSADEESHVILTKYQSSSPVTYYKSDKPVKIPKNIIYKKQEFRGVYVYTENNKDIEISSSKDEFKLQYLKILETIKSYNMNSIIFQVRPMNDAFYSSEFNPWSRFLTGVEGNDLSWDPLEWMIKESHKQGISFHAGFNAFQVSDFINISKNSYLESLDDSNFAKLNPDLVLSTFQNEDNNIQLFLNPGEDKVKEFIINSVVELIKNYDVDAVCLDNYYYPTSNFSDYQDKELYNSNNSDNLSLEDWRRENLNSLINTIKEEITDYNDDYDKNVQFGASVSGIWDNYSKKNELGSNTLGLESYDNQYTDSREWIKKDYLDYVIPQVKWEFDHNYTRYADVVDWWNDVARDTLVNIYIGQFLNRYSSNLNWENPQEIPNQLKYNQDKDEVKGSLFYSYKSLIDSDNSTLLEARYYLRNFNYNKFALDPSIPNLNNKSPKAISRLFGKYENNNIMLQWNNQKGVKKYIIYRFKADEHIDLNDTDNILTFLDVNSNNDVVYYDNDVEEKTIYKYFITALDYANNESAPAQYGFNLSPNEYFTEQVIIFIIISISSFITIVYTAVKVLKIKR